MYVRLGFAVAAHLESEVLIVDEVLAVGDVEFQKKCLNKMKEVSTAEGRTILFVSHNTQALRALCKSAILLENGLSAFDGRIEQTIEKYVNNSKNRHLSNQDNNLVQIKNVQIGNETKETKALEFNDSLVVKIELFAKNKIERPYFWLAVESRFGSLFAANSLIDGLQCDSILGELTITYTFPNLKLLPQEYTIHFGGRAFDGHTFLMRSQEIGAFNIVTSMQELGLNGILAEQEAGGSSPLLHSYTVVFGDRKIGFNPNNIK